MCPASPGNSNHPGRSKLGRQGGIRGYSPAVLGEEKAPLPPTRDVSDSCRMAKPTTKVRHRFRVGCPGHPFINPFLYLPRAC